ncbi:hypothetical protein P7K49_025950, partial [Saguinus oedipus]
DVPTLRPVNEELRGGLAMGCMVLSAQRTPQSKALPERGSTTGWGGRDTKGTTVNLCTRSHSRVRGMLLALSRPGRIWRGAPPVLRLPYLQGAERSGLGPPWG